MTDANKLRKGQRVTVSFTGVIGTADDGAINFRSEGGGQTMPVSWSPRLTPSIEVHDLGFRAGDLGIFTFTNGAKCPVMFKSDPSVVKVPGWYGPTDIRVAYAEDEAVQLVVRADGTVVDDSESVSEPEKPVYTPQLGDVVTYWSPTYNRRKTAFYRGNPISNSAGWCDLDGRWVVGAIKDMPQFELVLRNSELQEGVGIRD